MVVLGPRGLVAACGQIVREVFADAGAAGTAGGDRFDRPDQSVREVEISRGVRVNLLQVRVDDREALADAVVELVTNPERRRLMSDAARRDFLLRFSLDAMAIQSEEIYQLAIHNYGS